MREFLLTSDGIFAYFAKSVRETSLWELANRISRRVKPFLLATKIVRRTRIFLRVVETSAILLLAVGLTLAALPFALLAGVAYLTLERIRASRILRELELSDGRIYVVFSDRIPFIPRDGELFLVRGQIKSRFFCLKRTENATLISKTFFLRLRKRKFDAISERMVYIF